MPFPFHWPVPFGDSPDGTGQWPVLPKIEFSDTLSVHTPNKLPIAFPTPSRVT